MAVQTRPVSLRERIGQALRENKAAIAIDVLIITLVFVIFEFSESLRFPMLPIILLGTISLWLRGIGWRGIGLRRPESWGRTITLGVVAGALCTLFIDVIGDPLFARLIGEPVDLSGFGELRGNVPNALLIIAVGWIIGGLSEELTYRGYWMNRFADLFGGSQVGWIISIVVINAIFGYAHLRQGMSGVISSTLSGLAYTAVYFLSGRNLWAAIITHGMTNMFTILLVFFGMYPVFQ
jgi:hypothetical protein